MQNAVHLLKMPGAECSDFESASPIFMKIPRSRRHFSSEESAKGNKNPHYVMVVRICLREAVVNWDHCGNGIYIAPGAAAIS
jgi:hypothetical protein